VADAPEKEASAGERRGDSMHEDDDDDDNDVEEEIPLKLRRSNNFGAPFGAFR